MTRDDVIRMARAERFEISDAPFPAKHYCTLPDLLAFASKVAAAEREACAKVAGRMFIRDTENYPGVIAEAIRARGTP